MFRSLYSFKAYPDYARKYLVQNPTPKIAVRRSFGAELHVKPLVLQVIDLGRRQIDAAGDRAAGRFLNREIMDRRTRYALRPAVDVGLGRIRFEPVERAVDGELIAHEHRGQVSHSRDICLHGDV